MNGNRPDNTLSVDQIFAEIASTENETWFLVIFNRTSRRAFLLFATMSYAKREFKRERQSLADFNFPTSPITKNDGTLPRAPAKRSSTKRGVGDFHFKENYVKQEPSSPNK